MVARSSVSRRSRWRDVQSAGGSEAFQARSTLGRALALHLLAQTASGGWTIETTERGKPIARGEVERHVSISHTGSLVAAAAGFFARSRAASRAAPDQSVPSEAH